MTVETQSGVDALPPDEARRLIELATHAPSVHNTQPWSWRVDGNDIELYADMSRRLVVEDPVGRNLVISCGAALHHLQAAAEALGWSTNVDRMPDGSDPTLLARTTLVRDDAPVDHDALAAMSERRTDRRRFTSWPVPDERLQHLVQVASEWGCDAVPLLEDLSRIRMELLVETALAFQAADAAAAAERDLWVDRGHADGVPSHLVPAETDDALRNRFGPGKLSEGEAELETSDGVIVLGGTADDASAWLRTGEGLSALWLKATRGGLSVVPLSQPVEVEQTRNALRREVLGGLLVPHLVVRIGWQAIGRSQLPHSPRRPVNDVLRP
jgi:hypothetical protein